MEPNWVELFGDIRPSIPSVTFTALYNAEQNILVTQEDTCPHNHLRTTKKAFCVWSRSEAMTRAAEVYLDWDKSYQAIASELDIPSSAEIN